MATSDIATEAGDTRLAAIVTGASVGVVSMEKMTSLLSTTSDRENTSVGRVKRV